MKVAIALILLALCVSASALQQSAKSAPDATASPAAAQTEAARGSSGPAMSGEDVAALSADLSKMRVLVQQMELNLGAVTTSQSPLKYQFRLEIDMWRMVINQMERRIQG